MEPLEHAEQSVAVTTVEADAVVAHPNTKRPLSSATADDVRGAAALLEYFTALSSRLRHTCSSNADRPRRRAAARSRSQAPAALRQRRHRFVRRRAYERFHVEMRDLAAAGRPHFENASRSSMSVDMRRMFSLMRVSNAAPPDRFALAASARASSRKPWIARAAARADRATPNRKSLPEIAVRTPQLDRLQLQVAIQARDMLGRASLLLDLFLQLDVRLIRAIALADRSSFASASFSNARRIWRSTESACRYAITSTTGI